MIAKKPVASKKPEKSTEAYSGNKFGWIRLSGQELEKILDGSQNPHLKLFELANVHGLYADWQLAILGYWTSPEHRDDFPPIPVTILEFDKNRKAISAGEYLPE